MSHDALTPYAGAITWDEGVVPDDRAALEPQVRLAIADIVASMPAVGGDHWHVGVERLEDGRLKFSVWAHGARSASS